MNSRLIRQKFLTFFETKKHLIVDSAPLVNKDDPTLMFTNAGMNQFKDYFLGNKTAKSSRVADTQKCLRVSGKHNDLEEVGFDTYHHTMFEMLGNWSFGSPDGKSNGGTTGYFKKEAIEWAWELLTDVFSLPKERLYVSVFEGDKGDNLSIDQEAYDHWKKIISEDRILFGNKDDNFWEMGDTGPCGPCSEIHIDLRSDEEIVQVSGKGLVNKDHPQVVEVWNLVFMEFNRLASGELQSLPAKHVDTGMGFERLCMAIQNKRSNYETDVFTPLIDFVADAAKVKYGDNEKSDIAMRVIADHVRAIAFAITDGQLPSNTGAGYVIRRILRRGVRYAFTFLDLKEPFLYKIVPLLCDQFEGVFDGLREQKGFVMKVMEQEEASFLRTLEKGLNKLAALTSQNNKIISGEQAFELYDTYGFPFDLTALIGREQGLEVDEQGFEAEMAKQKQRSKADAVKETGDWVQIGENDSVEFIGYDKLTSQAKVVKHRTLKQKGKDIYQVVLDCTPFYAESGGQVGDNGVLKSSSEEIHVIDTKKENDLIVHIVNKLPADMNAPFEAKVNEQKRQATTANHSATHLLHAALRQVLGTHVEQKGSLVNDKVLRFDFSHFQKVSDEEVEQVERIANARVRQNIKLDEQRNVPIDEARKKGAMALFGEKYGDHVRVITFDPDYSVELCGGTHVKATGEIGMVKISSESSIAAGVRRIEAITGETAELYLSDQLKVIDEVKSILKNPADLKMAVEGLLTQKNKLEKEVDSLHAGQTQNLKSDLIAAKQNGNGVNVIIQKIKVPSADELRKLSFELKNEVNELFAVLAADVAGKPQIAVIISDSLVKDKDLHAGNIVRDLAREIQGGGGGQPFYATAGGKDLSGLDKVVEKATGIIS